MSYLRRYIAREVYQVLLSAASIPPISIDDVPFVGVIYVTNIGASITSPARPYRAMPRWTFDRVGGDHPASGHRRASRARA